MMLKKQTSLKAAFAVMLFLVSFLLSSSKTEAQNNNQRYGNTPLVLPQNGLPAGLTPVKPAGYYFVRSVRVARQVSQTVQNGYGGNISVPVPVVHIGADGRRTVTYERPQIIYVTIRLYRYFDGMRYIGPEVAEQDIQGYTPRY